MEQVELILLGEEVRKAVALGDCGEEELMRRLRAVCAASGALSHPSGDEGLFQFPNTESGWLATVCARRSLSFHMLFSQAPCAGSSLALGLRLINQEPH